MKKRIRMKKQKREIFKRCTCAYCRKSSRPKSIDQMYCSKWCMDKARKKKMAGRPVFDEFGNLPVHPFITFMGEIEDKMYKEKLENRLERNGKWTKTKENLI